MDCLIGPNPAELDSVQYPLGVFAYLFFVTVFKA